MMIHKTNTFSVSKNNRARITGHIFFVDVARVVMLPTNSAPDLVSFL